MKQRQIMTERKLREMYYQEQMSQPQIANQLGYSVATIYRAFNKYGMKGRNPGDATLARLGKDVVIERLKRNTDKMKKYIPKKEFIRLYKTMTLSDLAKHFKCGQTLIWKTVRKFNLKPYGRSERLLGKSKDLNHRLALSVSAYRRNMLKENNPNWKGGISLSNSRDRQSASYRLWRKSILENYGYACSICGKKQGNVCSSCGHIDMLHVHHKKSFAKFPKLRFSTDNGVIFCQKCHRLAHSNVRGEFGETRETTTPSEANRNIGTCDGQA